jgi:hypothetical protein
MKTRILFLAVLFSGLTAGCSDSSDNRHSNAAGPPDDTTELFNPSASALLAAMDTSVDPCEDCHLLWCLHGYRND